MSFAQELKDFVSAFETGYEVLPNKREREEHEWRREEMDWAREDRPFKRGLLEDENRRLNAAAAREEAEFSEWNTPEAAERRRRAAEAEISSSEAYSRQADALYGDEANARRARSDEATIKSQELQNEAAEIELQEARDKRRRILTGSFRKRFGREPTAEELEAMGGTKTSESAVPAPPRAGTAAGLASIRDQDRDLAIRTIIGEAGSQDFEGKQAVANVILNRANSGRYGGSISDVVLARNQFEPWSTRKAELMAYSPESREYQEAARAFEAAMSQDVTGGATHFLNPDIVRQRTGGSLPRWAQKEITRIGQHAFYAPEGRAADGAVGADRYAPGSGFAAIEAMDRGEKPGSKKALVRGGREAVKNTLMHIAGTAGLTSQTGVQTPERQMAMENYLTGADAGDEEDVLKAKEIVKEAAGEQAEDWSLAEENLYTLAATWDVAVEDGDMEKANQIAAAILQSYRQASSQWIAVAQAAAEDGKMSDAVEAAVKAYAYIPDGKEVDVKADEKGYFVEVKDIATGKTRYKQLVSPEEMYAKIMEFGPADFDKQLMVAAGEELPKPREVVSDAFAAQFPEYKGMTIQEAEEARLNKARAKAGGTGSGANVPTYEEFLGQQDEGGFGDAVRDVTTKQTEDPGSGKTNVKTSIIEQMQANGASTADIEQWVQGVGNIGYMAVRGDPEAGIEGFTGDQKMLASFIVDAVTDVEGRAPIQWDLENAQAIYKEAIRIPLNDDMLLMINYMRGQAALDRGEAVRGATASRTREFSEERARQQSRAVDPTRGGARSRERSAVDPLAIPGTGYDPYADPMNRAVPIP